MTLAKTSFEYAFTTEDYDVANSAQEIEGLTVAIRNAPIWLEDILRRIDALSELEPNWDSYGASKVHPASIRNAKSVICRLGRFVGVQEPGVTATPDGNVGFSWDEGEWSLDLEVSTDGLMDYAYIDERKPRNDVENRTRGFDELAALLLTRA